MGEAFTVAGLGLVSIMVAMVFYRLQFSMCSVFSTARHYGLVAFTAPLFLTCMVALLPLAMAALCLLLPIGFFRYLVAIAVEGACLWGIIWFLDDRYLVQYKLRLWEKVDQHEASLRPANKVESAPKKPQKTGKPADAGSRSSSRAQSSGTGKIAMPASGLICDRCNGDMRLDNVIGISASYDVPSHARDIVRIFCRKCAEEGLGEKRRVDAALLQQAHLMAVEHLRQSGRVSAAAAAAASSAWGPKGPMKPRLVLVAKHCGAGGSCSQAEASNALKEVLAGSFLKQKAAGERQMQAFQRVKEAFSNSVNPPCPIKAIAVSEDSRSDHLSECPESVYSCSFAHGLSGEFEALGTKRTYTVVFYF